MTFNGVSTNPLLNLRYELALESLGGDYFDSVVAAEFPSHILRFRNNELLPQLGLQPDRVGDPDFIETFGKFQGREPLLALRYHGYQFGEYNPALGDGRGFLYGQVRGVDGELYDFGTKGSGTTPYSRSGDGRLTLKGGVREVLAAESLHQLGVRTSRCLSMIETGESLWRGDEPSPTRSCVMVRFSRSHIRFGTFERLHYIGRPDLIAPLLDHVIQTYYPHLAANSDRYRLFYAELVERVASLVAQWMSVGFCHAVLNTDNMSITGESFDYGPYAFIPTYNTRFTAAYFDYFGRYAYGNQPDICRWNLEVLQVPLGAVLPISEMEAALAQFPEYFARVYEQRMLNKLGFASLPPTDTRELIQLTLQFLNETQVNYHTFFSELAEQFTPEWRMDREGIPESVSFLTAPEQIDLLKPWHQLYRRLLSQLPPEEMPLVAQRLWQHNPATPLLRPEIEAVWAPITEEDNWQPFYDLLQRIGYEG